ncbi:MAG TPA: sulfatase-like hydrolase/transferase [bacterium]|nr:sulfatase-like hydrolase/transferase [bacterium]HQL61534.1 sulfatase-like hydrolase/transferase [bacterium]
MSDLSRRQFLKTTGRVSLGASILGAPHVCRAADRKPNLLFLWTDEQRADTIDVYGNTTIQTPNMSRLAQESIVFKRAYVSQAVCTPSRSTVMTGLWPHESGCTQNNIPLPETTPCLPEILGDSDYRTGYFGKWHLGDEIFAQHGFAEWVSLEDGYRNYYRETRDKNQKSSYYHFLKDLGYTPDTSQGDFSRGFASRLKIEHCKPKFLELNACDFLRRHKNEPFILYVNFLEPHMPFFGPLNDLHSPEEISLPANFDDPLEEDEPLAYRLKQFHYREHGYGGLDLKTEAGWRRLIANYWGLCSQVDRSIGEILKTLETEGLANHTIVVYTSDHGDMMGSHRLLAKTVMYEEATRVPWMMRVPQSGFKAQVISQPVSHIDMVPTLLDLMGKPVEDGFTGHSLVPLMKGGVAQEDHVFIEWNPSEAENPTERPTGIGPDKAERALKSYTRTVVSPSGWKLCLNDQDSDQLFNLNLDPGETQNLFYTGMHSERIEALSRRIHQWQRRVGDRIVV